MTEHLGHGAGRRSVRTAVFAAVLLSGCSHSKRGVPLEEHARRPSDESTAVRHLKPGSVLPAMARTPPDLTVPDISLVAGGLRSSSALVSAYNSMHATRINALVDPLVACKITVWNRGASLLWENRWDMVDAPDLKTEITVGKAGPETHRGDENSYTDLFAVESAFGVGDHVSVSAWDRDVTTDESIGTAGDTFQGSFPFYLKASYLKVECRAGDASTIAKPAMAVLDKRIEALAKAFVFDPKKADFGYPTDAALSVVRSGFYEPEALLGAHHRAVEERRAKVHELQRVFYVEAQKWIEQTQKTLPDPEQWIPLGDGLSGRIVGVRCPAVLPGEDTGPVNRSVANGCGVVMDVRNDGSAPRPWALSKDAPGGGSCRELGPLTRVSFVRSTGEVYPACLVAARGAQGFVQGTVTIDPGKDVRVTVATTGPSEESYQLWGSPLLRIETAAGAAFLRVAR